jgi:hypothetical protein
MLNCHRRSGKTTALLADTVKRAIQGPNDGRYGFLAPYYHQAKQIAWDILLGLTEQVCKKKNESELRVDLINGSRIRLFGADNPDSLRGNRFDGAALDEFVDIRPGLWTEVIRPALADRQGWGVFSGTPKGRANHFADMWNRVLEDSNWFSLLLPASKSGILSKEELDEARSQMSEEVYQQEFECSFEAPRSGSYYGKLLEQSVKEGRLGKFDFDPAFEVNCALDLGFTDSTAIWYWQERHDGFAIIDWDEDDSKTIAWWIDLLRAKGYEYNTVWLPHDARAKSLQTGKSTIEQLLSSDVPCKIVPHLDLQHGIDATKLMIPQWYFNEPTTKPGFMRLMNYHREWDDKRQCYRQRPVHDQSSHSADAARYMALVQRKTTGERKKVQPVTTSIDSTFQLEVLFEDRKRTSTRDKRI